MALLDEHRRTVAHHALCDQAADERTGGAAGRGILPDAHGRVEEPGMRDGGRIDGIEAVQVTALPANLREGRRQPRHVGPRATDDRAIARGHQEVRRAGRDDLRRHVVEQVGPARIQSERPRQLVAIGHGAPELRWRLLHHDRIGPSVPTRHLYGQDTVSDLLRKHRPALGVELNPPGAGEPPPSAERIVSCADDLGAGRRERAQPPGRSRPSRGQHERRLGLVELTRRCPHHRLLQPFGIGDDGQRVAGQRSVGEHVDQDEGNGCAQLGVGLLGFRPSIGTRRSRGTRRFRTLDARGTPEPVSRRARIARPLSDSRVSPPPAREPTASVGRHRPDHGHHDSDSTPSLRSCSSSLATVTSGIGADARILAERAGSRSVDQVPSAGTGW
jgi:hypothetical protein